MADIVNLGDKLKAQREADAKYAARMDLTAKMIPVMVQTVDKFYATWVRARITLFGFCGRRGKRATAMRRILCLLFGHRHISDGSYGGYGGTCSRCNHRSFFIHDM